MTERRVSVCRALGSSSLVAVAPRPILDHHRKHLAEPSLAMSPRDSSNPKQPKQSWKQGHE